jgi:arabinofuranan 3-O-arabinosyltransferase
MVRPFARPSAHGATVAVLTVVLVLVVFLNSWGTFTTDTKPEVYLAPGRMLGEYLSAWTFSPYLGAPSFNGGLSAVTAVTGLLSLTGLSPELVFKVFHLALWLVAAAGASALGRRLDPRMGRRGGLVVAIVYLACCLSPGCRGSC